MFAKKRNPIDRFRRATAATFPRRVLHGSSGGFLTRRFFCFTCHAGSLESRTIRVARLVPVFPCFIVLCFPTKPRQAGGIRSKKRRATYGKSRFSSACKADAWPHGRSCDRDFRSAIRQE